MIVDFLLTRPLRIHQLFHLHGLRADIQLLANNLTVNIRNAISALITHILDLGTYSLLPTG